MLGKRRRDGKDQAAGPKCRVSRPSRQRSVDLGELFGRPGALRAGDGLEGRTEIEAQPEPVAKVAKLDDLGTDRQRRGQP